MSVVAVSMFHDEEDVAPYVVEHMLRQCDLVILADHRSSDGSRASLDRLGSPRLVITDQPDPAYRQAAFMQSLIDYADDGDWIVPFDFDEWWYSDEGRITEVLEGFSAESTAARTVDMIPQASDPADPNPFARIRWSRPDSFYADPDYRKVAFRKRPGLRIMQGNHGVEGQPRPWFGPLRIRHYPFRCKEQAQAKLRSGAAAVAAGAPSGSGLHWLEWGGYDETQFDAWWAAWTASEGLVR